MLGASVIILLWLLPSSVNGQITATAKCLSGYEWAFSSIGQSPCDVAAELATVCTGMFDLPPLRPGLSYAGPPAGYQNNCRCSSVYYSLQSACSYCQGYVTYIKWSYYITNCTSGFHLKVYPENIPVGVKVPAYAYQDVSVSDIFNVTLAQSIRGVESTRQPAPSSTTPSSGKSGTTNNTPAIIGGAVGGVVALGLIAALIIFLMLRSKQKTQKYNLNSSFQLNPSIIDSSSPPPGRVFNSDDRNVDPNININPSRPLSQNVQVSNAQNHMAQTMPRTSTYYGMPGL